MGRNAANPVLVDFRVCKTLCKRFTLWFLAFVISATPALSNVAIAKICEDAAIHAAKTTGVPLGVLRAITLTETGRKKSGEFLPWPWAVNMEGKGSWFNSETEARDYVYQNYARGARSFDVGCFQLNYRWHGKGFASIDQMFEPVANAVYAANFLKGLFAELGNWSDAAGAYHSRTPKFADRYRQRFDAIRGKLEGQSPSQRHDPSAVAVSQKISQESVTRQNSFPLLISGVSQSGALGSLVPPGAGFGSPSLFGPGK